MAELVDELLPDSFLQRCIGAFLEMLCDNAAAVSTMLECMTSSGKKTVYMLL
jgi:hypothetical protein